MEAVGDIDGAQRLAGLGRIDRKRFTGEVLLLVVLGLGPLDDLLDLGVGVVELELGLLVRQHLLVFRFAEQQFVVEDLVG